MQVQILEPLLQDIIDNTGGLARPNQKTREFFLLNEDIRTSSRSDGVKYDPETELASIEPGTN